MEQMINRMTEPMASPGGVARSPKHGVSALRCRIGVAGDLTGNRVTVLNGGTQWLWSPPGGTPG